jgi:peptidyl-prolyl cis-trans isomerase C
MNRFHRFIPPFPYSGSLRRIAGALTLAALVVGAERLAQAQKPEDEVLAENALVKLTRADYVTDLLMRVPAEMRPEFAANPARLTMLLNTLLIDKTLAQQARDAGLDRDPEISRRLALEADRVLAKAMVEKIERDAAADFDAREADFLAKAREVYAINKEKYKTPEQVSASHILFDTKKRDDRAALELAKDVRAKLVAGADFGKVAAEVSDDPTAKENGGALGWFGPGKMDPEFTKAAFALKNPGDLSEPVKSSFGWHVIRLDGHRPSREVPFERAQKQIMADLRSRYISDAREAKLVAISHDPAMKVNQAAVDSLLVKLPEMGVPPKPPAPKRN